MFYTFPSFSIGLRLSESFSESLSESMGACRSFFIVSVFWGDMG